MENESVRRPIDGKEFQSFFDDLFASVDDANRPPIVVLQEHGLHLDLPPRVAERLMPLLGARPGGRLGWAECGACGACGVCAACGGLNVGAPGAAAAAIWAIL